LISRTRSRPPADRKIGMVYDAERAECGVRPGAEHGTWADTADTERPSREGLCGIRAEDMEHR